MLGSAERSVKVTGTGVAAQQQEMQNGSGNLQISKVDMSIRLDASIRGIYKKCTENSTIHAARWIRCNSRCTRVFWAELQKSHKLCPVGNVNECEWNGMEWKIRWNSGRGKTEKERMHGYCGLQRKKDRKCARTNYRQISHGNCNWSIIHSN